MLISCIFMQALFQIIACLIYLYVFLVMSSFNGYSFQLVFTLYFFVGTELHVSTNSLLFLCVSRFCMYIVEAATVCCNAMKAISLLQCLVPGLNWHWSRRWNHLFRWRLRCQGPYSNSAVGPYHLYICPCWQ